MKIGDALYTRDIKRRVYKDDNGDRSSRPNPRYYWRAHTIIGETRDSWVLDNGARSLKVAKSDLRLRGELYGMGAYAYTAEAKADREWLDEHYTRLLDAVRTANVATLDTPAVVAYVVAFDDGRRLTVEETALDAPGDLCS